MGGGRSDSVGSASLAQLCQSLQRAADEERHQLARILHDSAAQVLAAAAMNLTLVERDAAALGAAARTALDRAQELVMAGCRQLGDLSGKLSPLGPGENGLAGALRQLAARTGRAGIQLTLPGPIARLDPSVELAAYRLVEETLDGALADGESVEALVRPSGEYLLVTLVGRARPPGELALTTLRLRIRARAVGGSLRVRQGARQTRIEARLPLTYRSGGAALSV